MANPTPPSSFPFQVHTTTGTVVSGYADAADADRDADRRNLRAEALGIVTRYVVKAQA